jgi:hypothetical protein
MTPDALRDPRLMATNPFGIEENFEQTHSEP